MSLKKGVPIKSKILRGIVFITKHLYFINHSFLMIFLFVIISFFAFINKDTHAAESSSKVLLLIAEQNIGSNVYYWWGTSSQEVDLSIVEPIIAKGLFKAGFEIVNHTRALKVEKPFRVMDPGERGALIIGHSYGADLVILGKALATQGGKVPGSDNMMSCNAVITGKVIHIKDGKVVTYVSGSGDSVHLNPITCGNEALTKAAEDFTNVLTFELTSKDK